MLRKFAPNTERPSPDQLREWHVGQLFHLNGTPINDEAGRIILEYINDPQATISAMIISRRTHLDPFLVRSLCRQMGTFELLKESPPMSACFKLSSGPDANHELINNIRSKFGADEPGTKS